MRRLIRAAAAFLLLAAPAGAQTVRVVPAEIGFPAASPAASALPSATLPAAPLTAAPLSTPTLSPSVPAAPVPAAAPALEAPPAAAPPAAALPSLAAAADRPADRGAAPGPAASPAAGRDLFDGSRLRTRSGSVFVLSRDFSRKVPGGVAFVRAEPSPAAPLKPVPNTQGLRGEALLARLGEIVARGQIKHEYHDASRFLFGTADNHTLHGVRGVAGAYSGIFVPGTSPEARDYSETGDPVHDGSSRTQTMNVEHVFPQTYFDGDLPMRSDLHHLMATFERPNEMRGHLPFGTVKTPTDYRNDAGAKRDLNFFEPPDFTKGRVARALLYFYTRYRAAPFFGRRAAAFWNSQIETVLDWNRRFPPTVEERTRNGQVEGFQGNRNPFVDDWTLADRIGADALRDGRAAMRVREALAAGLSAEAKPLTRAERKRAKGEKKRQDKKRKQKKRRSKYGRARRGRGARR